MMYDELIKALRSEPYCYYDVYRKAADTIERLHNVMTENAMLERDIASLETEIQRLRNAKSCDSCGYVTGVFETKEKADKLKTEGKNNRMKLVYIAHPFGGKPENVADAQEVILKLLKLFPTVTFYSPLHATGFFYHELSYEDGMEHCYEALSRCDELWLCDNWQSSRGCNLEVEFAKKHNIPTYELSKFAPEVYK